MIIINDMKTKNVLLIFSLALVFIHYFFSDYMHFFVKKSISGIIIVAGLLTVIYFLRDLVTAVKEDWDSEKDE
jgi:prepilin signal peptidase PulO-like enzyme (type II secretory pathway)